MRAPLRNELEAELRRLMGVWFPRCVDREHGGFLCDFDYRWKPSGSQVKMLEYQARQTPPIIHRYARRPRTVFGTSRRRCGIVGWAVGTGSSIGSERP